MDSSINQFCDFVTTQAIAHNKDTLIKECKDRFHLTQDRKVFYNTFFAVRFSWSKNGSFSNTVLSLSHLQKYDKIPFFVVLASQKNPNKIFLANTTFLKKISHSSQSLALDNIKGSFNGSDIMRDFNGTPNEPKYFEDLFSIHEATDWNDNLQRLCETSSQIKTNIKKYEPTDNEQNNIFNSIDRAISFIKSNHFKKLQEDLDNRVKKCKESLFIVSQIENNNIKGRLVEFLITSNEDERRALLTNLSEVQRKLPLYDTKNGLGDYEKNFDTVHAYVDIKVKIIYLNSNPKAFNIDKFLKTMAEENSVFLLYFVGFDEKSVFNTVLCSVYHKTLLESLIVQPHWAGRQSRGCAQYNGKIIKNLLEEKHFINNIDKDGSLEKLSTLLNI